MPLLSSNFDFVQNKMSSTLFFFSRLVWLLCELVTDFKTIFFSCGICANNLFNCKWQLPVRCERNILSCQNLWLYATVVDFKVTKTITNLFTLAYWWRKKCAYTDLLLRLLFIVVAFFFCSFSVVALNIIHTHTHIRTIESTTLLGHHQVNMQCEKKMELNLGIHIKVNNLFPKLLLFHSKIVSCPSVVIDASQEKPIYMNDSKNTTMRKQKKKEKKSETRYSYQISWNETSLIFFSLQNTMAFLGDHSVNDKWLLSVFGKDIKISLSCLTEWNWNMFYLQKHWRIGHIPNGIIYFEQVLSALIFDSEFIMCDSLI